MRVDDAHAPGGRAAALPDRRNGIDMGAQRLLMATVTACLQHPKQAGLAYRLDIGWRDLADLLGFGHALTQLRSERCRAGDELIMAELLGCDRCGRGATARFTYDGHGASS